MGSANLLLRLIGVLILAGEPMGVPGVGGVERGAGVAGRVGRAGDGDRTPDAATAAAAACWATSDGPSPTISSFLASADLPRASPLSLLRAVRIELSVYCKMSSSGTNLRMYLMTE